MLMSDAARTPAAHHSSPPVDADMPVDWLWLGLYLLWMVSAIGFIGVGMFAIGRFVGLW